MMILNRSVCRKLASYSTATQATHLVKESTQWKLKGAISLATLLVVPADIYFGTPALDFLAATIIPLHAHLGMKEIIVDYLPVRRTPGLNKIASAILLLASGTTFASLLYLNQHDIGLGHFIQRIWIGPPKKE